MQAVGDDGVVHVLQPHLAQRFDLSGHPLANQMVNLLGNADRPRFGQGFEPCGDVDALTEDVIRFHDDIAQVDADAQRQLAAAPGEVRNGLLEFQREGDRRRGAGEFDQEAVAHGLHQAALVALDTRIDQVVAQPPDETVSARLVLFGKAAIADDVGGDDCRESAPGRFSRHRFRSLPLARSV